MQEKEHVMVVQCDTRDNCSASLGKPRYAEQLTSWRNFQSAPHYHQIEEVVIFTNVSKYSNRF